MPNKTNGKEPELINRIGKILLTKQQTVAVAESVTSGFLQSAFSQAENARKFFEGGITTYTISQKTKHLNVDPVHALASNCVSEIVACEISMNVVKLFMTDWGIGIVGYAAPVPEKSIHELFAFYSIHHKDKEVGSGKIDVENNTPSEVQKIFTTRVLEEFYKIIKK
jgi:PncC family amidohydrolase